MTAAETDQGFADPDSPALYAQFDGSTVDLLDACTERLRLHDAGVEPADEDLIRGGYCVGWLKAANDFAKAPRRFGPLKAGGILAIPCPPAGLTYPQAIESLRTLADGRPDLLLAPAAITNPQAMRQSCPCDLSLEPRTGGRNGTDPGGNISGNAGGISPPGRCRNRRSRESRRASRRPLAW